VHAVASSLSLCVARPPLVVCFVVVIRSLVFMALFGHWHSWSHVLIDWVQVAVLLCLLVSVHKSASCARLLL